MPRQINFLLLGKHLIFGRNSFRPPKHWTAVSGEKQNGKECNKENGKEFPFLPVALFGPTQKYYFNKAKM